MKKKSLIYSPEFDFRLIGIVSTISDIKMAWELKQITELEIVRGEYHEIYLEKAAESQLFNRFEAIENNDSLSIYFLGNKSPSGYLVEELKNIDFFIIIKGFEQQEFADDLQKQLKGKPTIQAVFNIDIQTLSSKQKLLMA